MKANFETGLKVCSKCEVEQSTANFGFCAKEKDNLRTECKTCRSHFRNRNADRIRAQKRAWYERNLEHTRTKNAEYRQENNSQTRAHSAAFRKKNPVYGSVYSRAYHYGISPLEVFSLMWKQKGKCAGCNRELHSFKRFDIDHDHATGKVRGLLCGGCNRSLGQVQDNVVALRRLADYLESNGK